MMRMTINLGAHARTTQPQYHEKPLHQSPVEAGLSRESVRPIDEDAGHAAAFAGKPGSHRYFR
jgi:hypothetical protein